MHHLYITYIISLFVGHIFHHINLMEAISLTSYNSNDLIPSIVMIKRSNQQMLMPYNININKINIYTLNNINIITVSNSHITLKLSSIMWCIIWYTVIIQLISYRSYSINYRIFMHNWVLQWLCYLFFHWFISGEDNIDMLINAT